MLPNTCRGVQAGGGLGEGLQAPHAEQCEECMTEAQTPALHVLPMSDSQGAAGLMALSSVLFQKTKQQSHTEEAISKYLLQALLSHGQGQLLPVAVPAPAQGVGEEEGGGQSAAQAHVARSRGCAGAAAAVLVWLGPAAGGSWLWLGHRSRRQCSASLQLCSPINKRCLHRKGPGAACLCRAKAGTLAGPDLLLA